MNQLKVHHTLKLLRELLGKKLPADTVFSKLADLVVRELDVAVCSVYLVRPGDILELYATKGLAPDAVHNTFLRIGEGLVGEIALQKKGLSFADAQSHPSFVFKAETKEKEMKSLAGVPILSANQLVGVLVIQTKEIEEFSPEIMSLLETIALVIAELLTRQKDSEKNATASVNDNLNKLEGVRIIGGLAVGTAFIHKRIDRTFDLLSKNSADELKRLNNALSQIQDEIHLMLKNTTLTAEQTDIFNAYLMFSQDKGWFEKITKAIQMGLTAEASVQKVTDEMSGQMSQLMDPYIRERIHDLKDLSNRLMRALKGKKRKNSTNLPKDTILVAQGLGPAELLDYDTKKIKAILLQEGSQTMHVAIVARSLNIPMIGGIENILTYIHPDDELAIDANKGTLYINPSDEILDDFDTRLKVLRQRQEKFKQLKGLPAVTLDNQKINLNINIGFQNDLLLVDSNEYAGVGLYRTELPFMTSEQLPNIEKQVDIYHRSVLQAGRKPFIFRTLDIGSDKILPYFDNKGEENPAMGWRSIRITLDRRALLRNQLRAFIRAVDGRELYIMFPMIADVEEFLEAKKTLDIELNREQKRGGTLPKKIHVGTMLEVPSLLFQLPELLKHVDFISVGTNDLCQFLFATDRGNPMIWNRYDSLSPAVLKVLKYVVDECKKAGKPCSVCGEMASHPVDALALIALGFTSLSMNPTAILRIKAVVRTLNQHEVSDYIQTLLSSPKSSIREQLRSYAVDHNIFI